MDKRQIMWYNLYMITGTAYFNVSEHVPSAINNYLEV